MCKVAFFKNAQCGHKYFVLDTPCTKGRNLLTCPMFLHKSITYIPSLPPFKDRFIAPEGTCPWCDMHGKYDMRQIRVIKREKTGYRVGGGPSPRDAGVDVMVPKAMFRPKPMLCVVM